MRYSTIFPSVQYREMGLSLSRGNKYLHNYSQLGKVQGIDNSSHYLFGIFVFRFKLIYILPFFWNITRLWDS